MVQLMSRPQHDVTGCDAERQNELLWQMVEDISGNLALEPLLVRIIEGACTLIGAHDGAIGLYDCELDCIRTAASRNIPENELSLSLPRGHGLMGRVLELDSPVYCRYGDLPHPVRTSAKDMHMLGVPVRVHGELIGVFAISVLPSAELAVAAQSLLERFAKHAAYAIDNARKSAVERRRTLRFELIVRVAGIIASGSDIEVKLASAADAIHEILGFPNVEISLLDVNDTEVLELRIRGGSYKSLGARVGRMSVEQGITGAAVRERRAQIVNDVSKDPRYVHPMGVEIPRAELAVPILFADEVLGVVNVEGPRTFDELDMQSLVVVAEHLGLAIQSARFADESRQLALLEERQRLARELHDSVTQILSSIRMISQTLTDAWKRDPVEGEARTHRLSELAQMGFLDCHELLNELSPVPSSRRIQNESERFLTLIRADTLIPQAPGLEKAVDAHVSSMLPSQTDLRIDFSRYVPQSVEHEKAFLRICQEAISNTNRHAHASCMEIEACMEGSDALVRLSDDGQGISADGHAGRGISNMGQRLLALGGSFRVEARSPTGTVIEARLPRQDRTA
ncbi:MAG: GAF domain-containing protein [Pseudoxanthomonas sp.]